MRETVKHFNILAEMKKKIQRHSLFYTFHTNSRRTADCLLFDGKYVVTETFFSRWYVQIYWASKQANEVKKVDRVFVHVRISFLDLDLDP